MYPTCVSSKLCKFIPFKIVWKPVELAISDQVSQAAEAFSSSSVSALSSSDPALSSRYWSAI